MTAILLNQKLVEAAQTGRFAMVAQLVERYSTPINFQSNDDGTTALAAAVLGGFSHIVKYLVERGADVNLPNLRGETPLHLAILGDNLEIISFLLAEGAWIESEDNCLDSPLMFATREDKVQAVEILLTHGADPDHYNEDGETPASLAQEFACEPIRELFATYAGREGTVFSEMTGASSGFTDSLMSSNEMEVSGRRAFNNRSRSMSLSSTMEESDSCDYSSDICVDDSLFHSGSVNSPASPLTNKLLMESPRPNVLPFYTFMRPSF